MSIILCQFGFGRDGSESYVNIHDVYLSTTWSVGVEHCTISFSQTKMAGSVNKTHEKGNHKIPAQSIQSPLSCNSHRYAKQLTTHCVALLLYVFKTVC